MANQEKSGSGKAAALTVLALAGAGAWFGAEPLAKRFFEEPAVPQAPEKPAPPHAKRGPITIAIGFDRTRSPIMHDLPGVTEATRDFIKQSGVLNAGDTVVVCTFAESASCEDFLIPSNSLDAHLADIRPEPPRSMQTFVHQAIEQILMEIANNPDPIAFVWTDAQDNTKGKKVPLQPNHPPVHIVVPREKYLGDARKVDASLGGDGVEVDLARNADEFGASLKQFAGKLQENAQAEAQRTADGLYGKLLDEYKKQLGQFEEAKLLFEQQKAAAIAKIQNVKTRIKQTAVALIFLAFSVIGIDLYQRSKPKLRGYIIDSRNRFPDSYRLPPSQKPFNIRRFVGFDLVLTPSRDGVLMFGKALKDGEEIVPGVTYKVRDDS